MAGRRTSVKNNNNSNRIISQRDSRVLQKRRNQCRIRQESGIENKENRMANPLVVLQTSAGNIELELFPEAAPETVANFLKTVDSGFYSDTIFHRVIKGFMIQGGGMTADMREKKAPNPPVPNEAGTGLSNDRGTIAMARTMDPHSATVQFFINTVRNYRLNHSAPTAQGYGYCAFGKVTEGMDVVDAIENAATGPSGMHDDVPLEMVRIISAARKTKSKKDKAAKPAAKPAAKAAKPAAKKAASPKG